VLSGTLVACPPGSRTCAAAGAGRWGPLDLDSDPTTATASSATWESPGGGAVLWAGLYWGGGECDVGQAGCDPASVKLAVPGGGYAAVVAGEVASLHGRVQAFADVTALVASAPAGELWVADAAVGTAQPAGWVLVVVTADPGSTVWVVDGLHAGPVQVGLDTPGPLQATVVVSGLGGARPGSVAAGGDRSPLDLRPEDGGWYRSEASLDNTAGPVTLTIDGGPGRWFGVAVVTATAPPGT
jgi:hypothetical protein